MGYWKCADFKRRRYRQAARVKSVPYRCRKPLISPVNIRKSPFGSFDQLPLPIELTVQNWKFSGFRISKRWIKSQPENSAFRHSTKKLVNDVKHLRATNGHSLSWLCLGDAQTLDSNEPQTFAANLVSLLEGRDREKPGRAVV